jgi:hypothetical protein
MAFTIARRGSPPGYGDGSDIPDTSEVITGRVTAFAARMGEH